MAVRLPFFLEIGSEEIPDWMIVPALDQLNAAFTKLLADSKLAGTLAWVDATPRRLVLKADGLPEVQTDRTETVTGPPKSANPAAIEGFARKQGVPSHRLKLVTTAKGEFYGIEKLIRGRTTVEILASAMPDLILGIPWPKTMYWTGKGGPRFIRPIRWLVALLGDKAVGFEVAGVKSGDVTTGHRRFGLAQVVVNVMNHEEQYRGNHVILRAAERRKKIEDGIAALGVRVKPDAGLLHTLTYLTEWPTPIVGSFDKSYLELPSEVLVTVMRHHQKYFSVEREDGSLAPQFVAVMNIPSDPEGLVRAGNERVLRARFNDARFFWEADQRRPLAHRVEDLKNVTYLNKLKEPTYFDKSQRVAALVRELGGSPEARRAALLCKCDLTTEMVKEFTELQGVVGGLYARAQGEPEAVAQAVYEHYKPTSMEDSIPSTKDGQLVALADKADTLRECFAIGMIPKGSSDPFALRRAAQGVVKILAEGRIEIPLAKLAAESEALTAFFEDRVRYYFREIRGYPYDEVNAAMARGWSEVWDLADRLEALHAVRPTPDFEPLAASFKRIRNIVEQAKFEGGAVEVALLEAGPERGLYDAAIKLQLTGATYREALERIATLRPAVDLFFDKILVNAPDEKVRRNRLALLHSILTQFSSIADFSEIVTS
jgi:glycyl-tRNA synthetase beta chain